MSEQTTNVDWQTFARMTGHLHDVAEVVSKMAELLQDLGKRQLALAEELEKFMASDGDGNG